MLDRHLGRLAQGLRAGPQPASATSNPHGSLTASGAAGSTQWTCAELHIRPVSLSARNLSLSTAAERASCHCRFSVTDSAGFPCWQGIPARMRAAWRVAPATSAHDIGVSRA
jgi:hypothetical protein